MYYLAWCFVCFFFGFCCGAELLQRNYKEIEQRKKAATRYQQERNQ